MSEQEEEVEVIPRQMLSPLNYLEFDNYSCCPPLSPQYSSSGSDLSLWNFSDCINSHSTGDTNLLPSLQFGLVGTLNNKRTAMLATCKIIGDKFSWEWFAIDSTGTSSHLFRDSKKLNYEPEIGYRLWKEYLDDLFTISGRSVIVFESTGTSIHVFRDKLPEGTSSPGFPIFRFSGGRGVYVVDNTCKALKVGDVSHYGNLKEMFKPLINWYKNYILGQTWAPSDHCQAADITPSFGIAFSEIVDHLSKGKRVVDDKVASKIESIPTYQTNNATLGPEASQNGEESGKTYSVEQQRVLKFDSGYDRRKISDTRGKNPDPILKKARDRITLEDLEQHFELPLNDAAERLGFSRSTLKRLCREHDIPRWPSHKKKRINIEQNIEHVSRSVQEAERALAHTSQSCGLLVGSVDKSALTQKLVPQQKEVSVEAPHPVPETPQFVQHETPGRGNTIENIDTVRNLHAPRAKERVLESSKTIPPDSYPPQNKVVESFPSTNPSMQVAAVQDTRKITIKARYVDDIIKFPLSSSSGIAELQKEVIKRLNLRLGKFTIKYLDIDQDWILIACDEDLQACLSAGTGAIQMLIQSK